MTKGDKIRSSDDLYIAVQMAGNIVAYLCQSNLLSGTPNDHKNMISSLTGDLTEWLALPENECFLED